MLLEIAALVCAEPVLRKDEPTEAMTVASGKSPSFTDDAIHSGA